MRTTEAQPILFAYSYVQRGLITSAQARNEGINTTALTRLAQKDLLRRIRRGVYILSGVAEDRLTEVRAAWLSTRPEMVADERIRAPHPIVVSHVSAASVLGLGDITPAFHTFTSSQRKQTSFPDINHRTAELNDADWTVIDGLPVTTVERTIHDLARDHLDGDQLSHAIADGIHNHRVSPLRLASVMDSFAEQYGCDSGESFIIESLRSFPEPDSAREARFLVSKSIDTEWGNWEGRLSTPCGEETQTSHSTVEEALNAVIDSTIRSKENTRKVLDGGGSVRV